MIRIQIQVDAATAARAKHAGAFLKSRRARLGLAAVVLGIPFVAFAGPVTVPNTFSSGELISSSEMNDNFSAVKTAVDDNASRIATLESNTGPTNCAFGDLATTANTNTVNAPCPAGKEAITGTCWSNGTTNSLKVSSYTQGGGWECAYNGPASTIAVHPYCCESVVGNE